VQEAWLAVTEGRKPDSAVRALLRRESRQQVLLMDLENVDPSGLKACL
jgi:hypothetical protein